VRGTVTERGDRAIITAAATTAATVTVTVTVAARVDRTATTGGVGATAMSATEAVAPLVAPYAMVRPADAKVVSVSSGGRRRRAGTAAVAVAVAAAMAVAMAAGHVTDGGMQPAAGIAGGNRAAVGAGAEIRAGAAARAAESNNAAKSPEINGVRLGVPTSPLPTV
jgi:hypothetical protein